MAIDNCFRASRQFASAVLEREEEGEKGRRNLRGTPSRTAIRPQENRRGIERVLVAQEHTRSLSSSSPLQPRQARDPNADDNKHDTHTHTYNNTHSHHARINACLQWFGEVAHGPPALATASAVSKQLVSCCQPRHDSLDAGLLE